MTEGKPADGMRYIAASNLFCNDLAPPHKEIGYDKVGTLAAIARQACLG